MKQFSIASLPFKPPYLPLLFLVLFYTSCNHGPDRQKPTSHIIQEEKLVDEPIVAQPTEKKPAVPDNAIHSPAEAVMKYHLVVNQVRMLMEMYMDSTRPHTNSVPGEMLRGMTQLKQTAESASRYYARHRNEFSKEQKQAIAKDLDELGSLTMKIK